MNALKLSRIEIQVLKCIITFLRNNAKTNYYPTHLDSFIIRGSKTIDKTDDWHYGKKH